MQTAEIVKQIRNKSELTQVELSKKTDFKIPPSQISRWEKDVKIGLLPFIKLCKAADVKPSEILKSLGL